MVGKLSLFYKGVQWLYALVRVKHMHSGYDWFQCKLYATTALLTTDTIIPYMYPVILHWSHLVQMDGFRSQLCFPWCWWQGIHKPSIQWIHSFADSIYLLQHELRYCSLDEMYMKKVFMFYTTERILYMLTKLLTW